MLKFEKISVAKRLNNCCNFYINIPIIDFSFLVSLTDATFGYKRRHSKRRKAGSKLVWGVFTLKTAHEQSNALLRPADALMKASTITQACVRIDKVIKRATLSQVGFVYPDKCSQSWYVLILKWPISLVDNKSEKRMCSPQFTVPLFYADRQLLAQLKKSLKSISRLATEREVQCFLRGGIRNITYR